MKRGLIEKCKKNAILIAKIWWADEGFPYLVICARSFFLKPLYTTSLFHFLSNSGFNVSLTGGRRLPLSSNLCKIIFSKASLYHITLSFLINFRVQRFINSINCFAFKHVLCLLTIWAPFQYFLDSSSISYWLLSLFVRFKSI